MLMAAIKSTLRLWDQLGALWEGRLDIGNPEHHYRGCHIWARRLEIHLCGPLPWYKAHVSEDPALSGQLAGYHIDTVGDCLDHRRVHPQLQRLAGIDLERICCLVHLWYLRDILAVHEHRPV